jgi:hypothetical protein
LAFGRGQFDGQPGNFWPGAVGGVVIYDVALTAEQIGVLRDGTRPTVGPPARPAPDPSTYANGILNGTWDWVMDAEIRASLEDGLEAEYGKDADELRVRVGFDGHEWWLGFVFDGELWLLDGVPEGDRGTFTIDGDLMVQTGQHGEVQVTLQWQLEGDQLTMTVVEECQVTPTGLTCTDHRSQMEPAMVQIAEHTYTRSGDDPDY